MNHWAAVEKDNGPLGDMVNFEILGKCFWIGGNPRMVITRLERHNRQSFVQFWLFGEIAAALAILPAVSLLVWLLVRRAYPSGHCRKCGYNLTGNVSGICPECGTACSAVS